jgi:protein-disulfide isomerase
MENRYLLAGGIGALVVAAIVAAFLFMRPGAQVTSAGAPERQAALTVKPDDVTLGDPKAPITLIEYASSGCGACAMFHMHTLPELKKNWVDTGKVYYVFREYSLDNVALGASQIARCLPADQFFPFMDILFRNQRDWHTNEQPVDKLIAIAERNGISRATVESCLNNKAILDALNARRQEAERVLGVGQTPTLFINGVVQPGAVPYEELDAILKTKLPQ